MNKTNPTIVLILLLLVSVYANAQEIKSMQVLFDALKENPQTKSDEFALKKTKIVQKQAYSALYPKIKAFGSFDHSSIPMGMVPVPPNVLFPMIQNQSLPQPFSEYIYRAGVTISMPIFIKSIYTTAKKVAYLQKSAKAKKQINLLKNEAIIVSSNANLLYINALTKALESKKKSLLKTKEIIEVKVNNGRIPGSSLLKINNGINIVDATINEIAINREKAVANIEKLTGIRLQKPIAIIAADSIDSSTLKSLEPLEQKISADKLSVKAEKDKLLPSIFARGNYNHSFANSYNNDIALDKNYLTYGLVISIPVFNKNQYTKIKKSEIELNETKNKLDKLKLSLKSQANQLKNTLQLLNKSEKLYQQNIKDKEQILAIAKVSFKSGRITIEDYLKYEDDLVLEKAKLYKAQAEKWQTVVKLAVIYGNNIENLVK